MDVAPTTLYTLDLPIPQNMEGHLPEEIIKDETLQEQSPRSEEPSEEPQTDAEAPELVDPVLDAESEATIMARLRALGYVE